MATPGIAPQAEVSLGKARRSMPAHQGSLGKTARAEGQEEDEEEAIGPKRKGGWPCFRSFTDLDCEMGRWRVLGRRVV